MDLISVCPAHLPARRRFVGTAWTSRCRIWLYRAVARVRLARAPRAPPSRRAHRGAPAEPAVPRCRTRRAGARGGGLVDRAARGGGRPRWPRPLDWLGRRARPHDGDAPPAGRDPADRAGHPGPGDHLARRVRTGTFCSYRPDPERPLVWAVGADTRGAGRADDAGRPLD